MSKIFKIIFTTIIFFLVVLILNISFAANSNVEKIDPNSFAASQQSEVESKSAIKNPFSSSTSNDNNSENSNKEVTNTTASQPSAKITSLSESNLEFSNILSILLIVLGTLLVLLAIAILIRLKR